jgi:hypothetical protein
VQSRAGSGSRASLEHQIGAISAEAGPGSAVAAGTTARGRAPLRVAYQLQLSPAELRAVEFARGRYAWPDMLAEHASESGLVAFTEPEMWTWTEDVDGDAEGGHAPFPLASPELAGKLQDFYDQRI